MKPLQQAPRSGSHADVTHIRAPRTCPPRHSCWCPASCARSALGWGHDGRERAPAVQLQQRRAGATPLFFGGSGLIRCLSDVGLKPQGQGNPVPWPPYSALSR